MVLKPFLAGAFVKLVTGFDDTVTRIPVMASVTRRHWGRIFFSLGTLLAIAAAVLFALGFAQVLARIPYHRYVSAGLLFFLAIAIQLNLFVHRPRERTERRMAKLGRISLQRASKVFAIGFLAGIATVMDDVIAYSPLFVEDGISRAAAVAGIMLVSVAELALVVYFAKKIHSWKYADSVASAGLVLLGILVLAGVV